MKRLSLFTILLVLCLCSCGDRNTGLTVYCAHDAVYSQEILNAFSAETGIAVTAVFGHRGDQVPRPHRADSPREDQPAVRRILEQ